MSVVFFSLLLSHTYIFFLLCSQHFLLFGCSDLHLQLNIIHIHIWTDHEHEVDFKVMKKKKHHYYMYVLSQWNEINHAQRNPHTWGILPSTEDRKNKQYNWNLLVINIKISWNFYSNELLTAFFFFSKNGTIVTICV